MSECTKAQEIISAASDGELHDTMALEAAKEHCRSCAECATFVRTLAAIRRTPGPQMPADGLERVLEGVRAAYARAEPEPAPAETAAAAPDALAEPLPVALEAPTPVTDTAAPGRRRIPVWAPWAAAAAVLLIAAGVATTQGVRYLLSPSDDGAVLGEVGTTDTSREYGDEQAAPEAAPAPPSEEPVTATQGPAYVLFGQEVYALSGEAATPPSGNPAGTITSALDTGQTAQSYAVYPGVAPDTIIVATDEGRALVFSAVVRTLRGTPYALRSGSIGAFGQWPSLPPGIPEPSAPDGTPVFIEAGTDDRGVPIFVRPGTGPSSGFAVAPGTAPDDPAAGNTGWTWWEPQR